MRFEDTKSEAVEHKNKPFGFKAIYLNEKMSLKMRGIQSLREILGAIGKLPYLRSLKLEKPWL